MSRKKYKEPKKLVIVGAGFAGIALARKLGRNQNYSITLISNLDNFRYYPALYGSATAHSRIESTIPLSFLLYSVPRVELITDTAVAVDVDKHELKLASGKSQHYDILVFAIGVVTSYFNIPGLEEYSYGIKSIEEVLELRRHLHEELIQTGHLDRQYVVVGAGPTGVELSAALVSYLRRVAKMHGMAHSKITIDLIEGSPRVLQRMSLRASEIVTRRLKKLGVNVMTGMVVEGESHKSLHVAGRALPTETVIWTAGVTNNPFFSANAKSFKFDAHHKVVVDSYMMAAPDVYVLGDNASTKYSGLAQVAIQDGHFLARHLARLAQAQPARPYKQRSPATVIPVGKNWAIIEYRGLALGGPLVWLIRRAADLIGYMDISSFLIALTLWLADRRIDDDCMICRQKNL